MDNSNSYFDNFSSDRPLENPEDDRLGYSTFAKHLANSIHKKSPSKGFVIGIYAPWGTGKSTVLNFIKHYLTLNYSEENKPIIIEFNPWWFTNPQDLLIQFLLQLNTNFDKWTSLKSVAKPFADFIEGLTLPILNLNVGKGIKNFIQNAKDLHDLKEQISKVILNQEKQIIVFIDDIDRLTPG